MFHHPAWAVGSYSKGHQPGQLPKSKSTQPRFARRWATLYLLIQGYCFFDHGSCVVLGLWVHAPHAPIISRDALEFYTYPSTFPFVKGRHCLIPPNLFFACAKYHTHLKGARCLIFALIMLSFNLREKAFSAFISVSRQQLCTQTHYCLRR